MRDLLNQNTENIWFWANAYKVSLALFALSDTGVLEKLAEARSTVPQIALDLGLSGEVLEIIFDLLERVGIVERNELGFALKNSFVAMLPCVWWEGWLCDQAFHRSTLTHVIRGGSGLNPRRGRFREQLPSYLTAMATGKRTLAAHLVRFAKLQPGTRLVDLGGADGALVLGICRLIPDIEAVVIDLQEMEEGFRHRMREAEIGSSVRFVCADLTRPDIGTNEVVSRADVVLLSNVLHLLSRRERLALLRTIKKNLPPNGRIMIYDQFIRSDGQLDSTNLLTFDWLLHGCMFRYSEDEFGKELSDLGFVSICQKRMSGLSGALLAGEVP